MIKTIICSKEMIFVIFCYILKTITFPLLSSFYTTVHRNTQLNLNATPLQTQYLSLDASLFCSRVEYWRATPNIFDFKNFTFRTSTQEMHMAHGFQFLQIFKSKKIKMFRFCMRLLLYFGTFWGWNLRCCMYVYNISIHYITLH